MLYHHTQQVNATKHYDLHAASPTISYRHSIPAQSLPAFIVTAQALEKCEKV